MIRLFSVAITILLALDDGGNGMETIFVSDYLLPAGVEYGHFEEGVICFVDSLSFGYEPLLVVVLG